MNKQLKHVESEEDDHTIDPDTLPTKVKQVWMARRRARRLLRMFTPVIVSGVFMVSCSVVLQPYDAGSLFQGIWFWLAATPALALGLIAMSLNFNSYRLSGKLVRALAFDSSEFAREDDVIAATATLNWTSDYSIRARLADRLTPYIEAFADACYANLNNMALESLTEVVRCARHPKSMYPSYDLVDASLRLIRLHNYVDAQLRVEQLAAATPGIVARSAGECAAHLLALVEGSNDADYLLRGSAPPTCDDSELVRAVDWPAHIDASDSLRAAEQRQND